MKTVFALGTALALAITAPATAQITYVVNQAIGLGSVVGSVRTNGTLGVLGQSDVIGFDLTVSGPGASVVLNQVNSVFVSSGNNLNATATNLTFDYSGISGFALFQLGSFGTGQSYYCNASVSGTCFQGASAIPEAFNSPSAQVEGRFGVQSIGTVAAIPEPATWGMVILGFGMVGAGMRRRKSSFVAA